MIAASSLLRNSTLSSAAYSIAVTKASRQSALRMETFIYISFFISSVRDQFRVTATPQWYVLPPPLTLPVVSTVAREVGCEFYREPGVWCYPRYPRRALDLEGCRILRMALASIWRIRSRVRPNCLPISSRVWVRSSSRPKRILRILCSRSVSVDSGLVDLVTQHLMDSSLVGCDGSAVLDEVAEEGVLFLA